MLLENLQLALDQIDLVVQMLHASPNKPNSHFVELGIGRHVRHVTDHVQALLDGARRDQIDFNYRTRNSATEHDTAAALALIAQQKMRIDSLRSLDLNRAVLVLSEISFDASLSRSFHSSVAREVVYLINHTIHHAAYIKLLLANREFALPAHIGLAPCTASHVRHSACVALAS
jgi:hypothetical protein